jgi:hypothetical protein
MGKRTHTGFPNVNIVQKKQLSIKITKERPSSLEG